MEPAGPDRRAETLASLKTRVRTTALPDFTRGYIGLPAYPLAGVPELRRRLEAEGVDVIDVGAGDADLAPPPAALERLREAVWDPAMSRYPFQLGLREFRQAAASWMAKRFGVELDAHEELLPLIGSKEGIAKLPLAFVRPGDATIVPDPGYQAYRGGTLLAGGEPHLVPLRREHGFLIPLDELHSELLDRARILYLNYPNNPTAGIASREYFEDAVALCREHRIILVHDHAYSEIAFDGYRPPSILEIPGAKDVAVEFHSMSKTYNMTGWRLAWAAGGSALIASLARVKSFMDTGPFLGIQAAGAAALESYDEWVPGNVERFRMRRDTVVEALRSAGFDVESPIAALYAWVPVPGDEPSISFARRALEQEGVIIVPGSAMGSAGEGYFRVALTLPRERLAEAAERLGRVAHRS